MASEADRRQKDPLQKAISVVVPAAILSVMAGGVSIWSQFPVVLAQLNELEKKIDSVSSSVRPLTELVTTLRVTQATCDKDVDYMKRRIELLEAGVREND
jgi:outer membrane murein-binding lipoprotein Lpp